MARVFLSLGSNIGNREDYIMQALTTISYLDHCALLRQSPLYETTAVGGPLQGDYVNQVVEIETSFKPDELLGTLAVIEELLGRERFLRFGPRTIDIDILFYDNLIIQDEQLTIPHPRLHERLFVLVPLADLAADFVHPVIGKRISDLMDEVKQAVGDGQKVVCKMLEVSRRV